MKKKIKIAFIINYRLDGWLGVTNYYINLFQAISEENNKDIDDENDDVIQQSDPSTLQKEQLLAFKIIQKKQKELKD